MKTIGNNPDKTRQTQVVASGALPNGKPVIVNSDGTVSAISVSATSKGTAVEFHNVDTYISCSAFDSNSNKVVVFYNDTSNSNNITAVVGTVDSSDNSISFGSTVVVSSGTVARSASLSATFDSNSNKIVASWSDTSNSFYGTAIVGTVSGTSISFGSAVIFKSGNTIAPNITFDSNSNKVVIAYRDQGNSSYGTAIVGTVSGTSISFGSAAVFESANTRVPKATFDSNSNKVVITFFDNGDSNKGKAVVGTVSGTSISFGSAATYDSGNLNGYASAITFDSNSNKVVIAWTDDADSDYAKAIVGTVSGTSISFGGAALIGGVTASTVENAVFDTTTNKVCIAYKDTGNSSYGTLAVGSVSGTQISFETPFVLDTSGVFYEASIVYDSNTNRVVISYAGETNDGYVVVVTLGTGTNLTSENFIGFADSAYADTQSAAINSTCSVDRNQSGLTAGQKYYVQTDGSLGTTAADPSVEAGTAISATEILVKG